MRASTCLVLASLLPSIASAQNRNPSCDLDAPRAGLREIRDVPYTESPGTTRRFDLARPDDDVRRPAVILIHGGGWAAGSRELTHRAMRTYAARGYVAVSVGYRLARRPRDTFPAAISDVRCAVRHVRADAARYGIDPERIAAVGFSAGGHLAAMLALAADTEGLDDGSCSLREGDVRVRGAVAWYAPFDLRTAVGTRWPRVVSDFLGGAPAEVPERAALASPITHPSAGDAPIFMVHGTEDPIVSIEEARGMLAALRRARVQAQLVEVQGAGHGFPFASRRYGADTACASISVVDTWLRAP
jgi:acetyl esterase/lipase